jgi:hypothetical protein
VCFIQKPRETRLDDGLATGRNGTVPPPGTMRRSTMTARDDASATDLGPAKHCGAYTPGHEVHYIQARISSREGPGTSARISAIDDDGTIHFADGTTKWNHEPKRLRRAVDASGPGVLLCAHHVLRVPHPGGAYCFCLGDAPSPCPGPAKKPTSVEDLVTQLNERGGFLIPGADALRLRARPDPG